MAVQGYPSATSVVQGGSIDLHISSDPLDQVSITVSRVGSPDAAVWSGSAGAGPQPVPAQPDGDRLGFGWPATVAVPIGADWASGLYRVDLDPLSGSGSYNFHIVVRAADPGTSAPTLLMYPATTGQAYNNAGGLSLYEFESGGVAVDQVSFDRPGGLDYYYAVPFARWFDAASFATEACTNIDVHAEPELLSNYRLVVSMGHDEYWSREMRDAVEGFVTRGGNAAFLSGNVCWWQVRFSDDNRIMICHKDAATDPLAGSDNSRVTVNWADYPVCRPENMLTGVGWRKGSQVNGAATGYICRFPEHWVFDQTGLSEGDTFGGSYIGYETDTCDFEEIDGRPQATSADGTPPSFVILATADYSAVGDTPGYATMGLFRRGGWVFTAASINWGIGLQAGDAHLQTITSNVLSRLSGPDPDYGWERIGEAIDVVAMAAEGGQLFVATSDGQLWQRRATAQNLHWQPIGLANVIAMAANGYAKPTQKQPLYAIDDADRLWQRDPDPQGTWSALTSANGCTALAVNNNKVLVAVDSSNTLWTRSVDPAAPWVSLGPSDVQVRFLAAQYRSLIACDDNTQLWQRPFWSNVGQLGSPWVPFGDAVPDITAMAITEGTLYAATSAGVLWRRDLTPGQASLISNQPLTFIRFVIQTGADDLGGGLNGSSATADVLLPGAGMFTVTLRDSSEPNWDNWSTHTVDVPIPATVNPPLTQNSGIAGVRINLVQDNPDWSADNWDIASLSVSLFNPPFPSTAACQLNLVGTSQLQDGSTGLVRLSKNPDGSGNGPSSPFYSTGPGSGCP